MTDEQILSELKKVVTDYDNRYSCNLVNKHTNLSIFNMDSLDKVELMVAIEQHFGIQIDDDKIMCRTVGDVVAYINTQVNMLFELEEMENGW